MGYFRGKLEPPKSMERMEWSTYVIKLQDEQMRASPEMDPATAREIVYDRAKADIYSAFPFAAHVRLIGPDPRTGS